jgi:hypothetical protein
MESSELIKLCYEWRIQNLGVDRWVKKLEEDIYIYIYIYMWKKQLESI